MHTGGLQENDVGAFFDRLDQLYQDLEKTSLQGKDQPSNGCVPADSRPQPPPGIPVYKCELCGVVTVDINQYNEHMNGKRHEKEVRKEKMATLYAKTERTLTVDTNAAERLIGRAIGGRRGDYLQKRVRIRQLKEKKRQKLQDNKDDKKKQAELYGGSEKESKAPAKRPIVRKLSSRMAHHGSFSYLKQEDEELENRRRLEALALESDSDSL